MAACGMAAIILLSGCGENRQVYDQAGKDLEQGSYSYALEGYLQSAADGVEVTRSHRGAGLACLRLGRSMEAAEEFTLALQGEKVSKQMQRDLYAYRATAYLEGEDYSQAMADCQTLRQEFGSDLDICFLTGAVALAMDSYEEARAEFEKAYELKPSYETAFMIYQEYLDRGMEADGTYFLEKSLNNQPKSAQDYCDRGRVYYYMEDYGNAAQELIQAVNKDSTDALLLLGMVYLAQHDSSNARAMYTQYVTRVGNTAKGYNGLAQCDIEDGNFESALRNIENGIPTATTEEMQSLLFNEIVVYEKRLDFATAEEKCREYTAMFPDDEAARKELVFLRSRTGHLPGMQ